jgi:hypothetical protein
MPPSKRTAVHTRPEPVSSVVHGLVAPSLPASSVLRIRPIIAVTSGAKCRFDRTLIGFGRRALGPAQIGAGRSAGETRMNPDNSPQSPQSMCAFVRGGDTGLLRCRAEQRVQRFGAQGLTPPIRFSAEHAWGFPLESADLTGTGASAGQAPRSRRYCEHRPTLVR